MASICDVCRLGVPTSIHWILPIISSSCRAGRYMDPLTCRGVAEEEWQKLKSPAPAGILSYVLQMRDRLEKYREVAEVSLEGSEMMVRP